MISDWKIEDTGHGTLLLAHNSDLLTLHGPRWAVLGSPYSKGSIVFAAMARSTISGYEQGIIRDLLPSAQFDANYLVISDADFAFIKLAAS